MQPKSHREGDSSTEGSPRVVDMTEAMIPQVVEMHMRAFKGYMGERLGPIYIGALMRWFQNNQRAISLVAIGDADQPVGYTVGAVSDYAVAMNRELMSIAAWAMIRRPWLLLDRRIVRTVFKRLQLLLRNREDEGEQLKLPEPTMALVGIGVSPSAHGRGIGRLLMEAFESRSRNLSARAMLLSVYPNNATARKLYSSCGWEPREEPPSLDTTMYYVRILEKGG